jgi:uncharacterized protein (DUF2225 family)
MGIFKFLFFLHSFCIKFSPELEKEYIRSMKYGPETYFNLSSILYMNNIIQYFCGVKLIKI